MYGFGRLGFISQRLLTGAAMGLLAIPSYEPEGLALDFTDASGRGSVAVRDLTTPANNKSNAPIDTFLTDAGTSPKLVQQIDGTYAYAPHNQCLQSETFQTTWTNNNSTENVNAATAPDGTLTAERLIDTAGGGTGIVQIEQNFTFVASALYTYSCYMKADQLTWGRLNVPGLGALVHSVYFNLATGVIGLTLGANNISQGVESVGNGWYRCWITFQSDAADTSGALYIYAADGDGDATCDLDGTSSVFIWGAQLNRGLTPTRYMRTTTAAVYAVPFEYDSGWYGLIEPAATNLVLWSRDLTQVWSNSNTTDAKTATGIDGQANQASTLTATSASGNSYITQTLSSGSAARITSLFARRRTGTSQVWLYAGGEGADQVVNGAFAADTDWTKGTGWTIAGGVAVGTAATGLLSQTQTMTNRLVYRLGFTIGGYAGGTIRLRLGGTIGASFSANGTNVQYISAGNSDSLLSFEATTAFTGTIDNVTLTPMTRTEMVLTSAYQRFMSAVETITNPRLMIQLTANGDEIDVDFVQNELGSVATSPINTFAATVTRATDAGLLSALTSTFPLGTAYTMYLDAYATLSPTAATQAWLAIDDGTANERVHFVHATSAADTIQNGVVDGGVTVANQAAPGGAIAAGNPRVQVSGRFALNNVTLTRDGGAIATVDTSVTMPTVTTLRFGRSGSASSPITTPLKLRRFVLVPRAVADADLPTWRYAA